ncbi:SIMPL domain-containing protein [Pontibacter sp. MBLB2868]|uniref:SIMPL domain-containing protein n=1 Tax=Pontibacter sp. MBLB2868 TaxID=3451555 RepID=UPI003F753B93
MKKQKMLLPALLLGLGLMVSCTPYTEEDNYLEVIGEYEQQTPEAGYRLNLSYNGPVELRDKFTAWADSMKKEVPSMVKSNENIYLNYMPEQMGKKISKDMYQTSVTYLLTVNDSAMYSNITQDLLKKNLPFNLNVMGTFIDPARKVKLQHTMMQKALENAKAKLALMSDEGKDYEIVSVEELDNTTPYGPEYDDFNRRMITRLKVKAKLQ